MSFVPNVNITIKEYNELKKIEKQYEKVVSSMNWTLEEVYHEENERIRTKSVIICTVDKEKLKHAITENKNEDIGFYANAESVIKFE